MNAFADPAAVPRLTARIAAAARAAGPTTLMEVCGSHTNAIGQHGIRGLLPPEVRLVSGPGCPVCVTPVSYVDHACALAALPGVTVTTFGDMLRVPGSRRSLAEQAAAGGEVRLVTSSLQALELAKAEPGRQVVFLGVGFETTAPTVAAALDLAHRQGVENFSVLSAHKTVPPALEVLVRAARRNDEPSPAERGGGFQPVALSGLICPGHVSAIIGTAPYEPLAARGVACVVAGFEPLEILLAIAMLLEQLAAGEPRVENAYGRVVRAEGNPAARELMERVFAPCDAVWRGLGPLAGSGLRLRRAFAGLDAAARFAVELPEPREPAGCRCGEVLCGTIHPHQCPLFAAACTPERPVGACMVSSEGSCAAAHRYPDQFAP